MPAPRISVCIPAYNRPGELRELLDSVLAQDFEDYEIVIVEDRSPSREQIRAVVEEYAQKTARIRYFENEKNLGYDANLRATIAHATGDYCFFMGNDDLMAPGALRTVADGLARHPNVGVILRTWAAFAGTPDNIVSTSRYFEGERFFPAGADAIATFYRRCVVIPGLTVHRASSVALATDRFDGTTLYQLHLVANILAEMNGLFLPEVLVYYRMGNIPEFGHSEAEKGKFTPETHTPEGSLYFIRSLLDIARHAGEQRKLPVYPRILKDTANYSYPLLSIQSDKSFLVFTKYAMALARLGVWRSPMFFAYFLLLVTLGERRVNALIGVVRNRLGRTPVLGTVYQGEKRS